MTLASIPAGAAVFLDANTLIYHFAKHPKYGAACTALIQRWSYSRFKVSSRPTCSRTLPTG